MIADESGSPVRVNSAINVITGIVRKMNKATTFVIITINLEFFMVNSVISSSPAAILNN
jgi:hypothetical protein